MTEPYLKEKMGKKRHEYDAMRRNLMDRLEGMAQESEEILKKIYDSVGRTRVDIQPWGEYRGPTRVLELRPVRDKKYKNGSFEIEMDDNLFYVTPDVRKERRERITQRTGLAKLLFGPEKKEVVEENVPTGRLVVTYVPKSIWNERTCYTDEGRIFYYYYDKFQGEDKFRHMLNTNFGIPQEKDPTLVEMARKIKERGDIKDAEKFAELNKRIRELPSQIVEHLDKRSKELESARSLGSVKDVDKLDYIKADCRYCGAPNPDLKSVCGHCGHKAYEIPKKTKQK